MEEQELKQYMLELERYKCEIEKWKTEYHSDLVTYQQVNMQGQGALKASLLINGGASVALLAFIGTAIGKPMENSLLLTLSLSMLLFIIATFLSAMACGATYLSGLVQNVGGNEKRCSNIFLWFFNLSAIFMVIAS